MGSHFMWQKYRFLHGKCWRSTFTHEFVFTKPISEAICEQLSFVKTNECIQHRHCSIAALQACFMSGNQQYCTQIPQEKHAWNTRVKKHMQNYMRKYTQIFLIACKTLQAHCYNLCVFGLLEFLHCWLSERSCTCAGGFVSKNQTFKARQMLVFYVIWAKSDPSFLTEWTLFSNI